MAGEMQEPVNISFQVLCVFFWVSLTIYTSSYELTIYSVAEDSYWVVCEKI